MFLRVLPSSARWCFPPVYCSRSEYSGSNARRWRTMSSCHPAPSIAKAVKQLAGILPRPVASAPERPSYCLCSCLQRKAAMFRATSRLLECQITFFTRSPCGLCDSAKAVVQNVNKSRPLQYREINVMEPGQERWKDVYEFDTPVVSQHHT